jgi:hypothetical protein
LSWRRSQPDDIPDGPEESESEEWMKRVLGLTVTVTLPALHQINPSPQYGVHSALQGAPLPNDIRLPYTEDRTEIPCSRNAKRLGECLGEVKNPLTDMTRPENLNETQLAAFARYSRQFFIVEDKLWRKDPDGKYQIVTAYADRLRILYKSHDQMNYKGVYSTNVIFREEFWWPQHAS